MQKQCSVVLLVLILELEGHGREKTEEAACVGFWSVGFWSVVTGWLSRSLGFLLELTGSPGRHWEARGRSCSSPFAVRMWLSFWTNCLCPVLCFIELCLTGMEPLHHTPLRVTNHRSLFWLRDVWVFSLCTSVWPWPLARRLYLRFVPPRRLAIVSGCRQWRGVGI